MPYTNLFLQEKVLFLAMYFFVDQSCSVKIAGYSLELVHLSYQFSLIAQSKCHLTHV